MTLHVKSNAKKVCADPDGMVFQNIDGTLITMADVTKLKTKKTE